MNQGLLNWLGALALIVWSLIGFWGVRKFKKLQQRYIDAIARVTGYRVEWLRDVPLGLPNIYAQGTKARRLQKAYSRAIYRQTIIHLGLLLGWMALVILVAWLLSALSG